MKKAKQKPKQTFSTHKKWGTEAVEWKLIRKSMSQRVEKRETTGDAQSREAAAKIELARSFGYP